MIQEKTARRIASCWSDGQSSPLYKFQSTGYVSQGALDELQRIADSFRARKHKMNKRDFIDFCNLIIYLRTKLSAQIS